MRPGVDQLLSKMKKAPIAASVLMSQLPCGCHATGITDGKHDTAGYWGNFSSAYRQYDTLWHHSWRRVSFGDWSAWQHFLSGLTALEALLFLDLLCGIACPLLSECLTVVSRPLGHSWRHCCLYDTLYIDSYIFSLPDSAFAAFLRGSCVLQIALIIIIIIIELFT